MTSCGPRSRTTQYNRPEMNGHTTPADGTRLVRVSPVQDAFIRKLAEVTDLVLAADPDDVPASIREAALDAHALFRETRS